VGGRLLGHLFPPPSVAVSKRHRDSEPDRLWLTDAEPQSVTDALCYEVFKPDPHADTVSDAYS
jgi:hypothetical protein